MSISSETSRNNYVGTGLLTDYDYGFRIFDETHLLVTTRTSAGIEATLVLNTDYTVDGVGDATGGSITLAAVLASGTVLSIRRVLPLTQPTDIRNQGDFFPETHEDTFDRLVMIDQQQQDEIDRSFKFNETEPGPNELPSIEERANTFLAFDSDGQPIVSSGGIDSIPVSTFIETLLDDSNSAAARSTLEVNQTNLGISAFAQTLLDDANAGAVLTTLGITTFIKTLLDDANLAAAQTTLDIIDSTTLQTRIQQALLF